MTLIGKIEVFIIFILSIVFGVVGMMVFSSHRNWKDYAKEKRVLYDAQVKVNEAQRTSSVKKDRIIREEKVARAHVVANLYADKLGLETDLTSMTTERNNLRGQASDLQTRLAQANDRVAELDRQIADLRQKNIALVEATQSQQEQVVRLIDAIQQTEFVKDTLKERANQLASDIADYERVLKAVGLNKDSLTDHIPPEVDGFITDIGGKGDVVQINLGLGDGIHDGHELEIYRRGEYIGKIRVYSADDNTSGASVVSKIRPIRVRDEVTTRLILKDQLEGQFSSVAN